MQDIQYHECPICNDIERKLLYCTRDRHYGIEGQWNITECINCKLVQISPMLTCDELVKLYPKTFYAYDSNRHNQYYKEMLKKFFFSTLIVKNPVFITPGKVLDYGCGTGWSLLKLRNEGWNCVGIEPNENASEIGRSKMRLDIKNGTIHTVPSFEKDSFDYIRANHSLEHDPDVFLTICEFERIIKPDGKLLIGVPNINSIPARIFGKYWWYLGAPVHTYNFSTETITKLCNRCKFEVKSVRYTGNYTGILGSLQIFLNRKNKRKSMEGFVFNFPPFLLLFQFLAVILNWCHAGDAIEIIAEPRKKVNS